MRELSMILQSHGSTWITSRFEKLLDIFPHNTIQGLNREIAFLRAELEKAIQGQNQEKMRSSELDIKLRSLEQELRNRIAILEAELVNERGRSNIDVSTVDTRLKGEYEARLKAELKALRKMYEDHMRVSKEEFMYTHNQKVWGVLIKKKIIWLATFPNLQF